MSDECEFKSDEYCVCELWWWSHDDFMGTEHKFPDATLRYCEVPCPYIEFVKMQREITDD